MCRVVFQMAIVQVVACDPNDLEPLRETLLLEDRGVISLRGWSLVSSKDHVGQFSPALFIFLQAECGGARHLLPMLAEQACVILCPCLLLRLLAVLMLWDPTTNGMARMKNIDCSEPFVDVCNSFLFGNVKVFGFVFQRHHLM